MKHLRSSSLWGSSRSTLSGHEELAQERITKDTASEFSLDGSHAVVSCGCVWKRNGLLRLRFNLQRVKGLSGG